MFTKLLNKTFEIRSPRTTFDGLGESADDDRTKWTLVATVKGRLKTLSSYKKYQDQGGQAYNTHKLYIAGQISTYPGLKAGCYVIDTADGRQFEVHGYEERFGMTSAPHHLTLHLLEIQPQ